MKHLASGPKKTSDKLTLNRETIANLHVRSAVKTGALKNTLAVDCATDGCHRPKTN